MEKWILAVLGVIVFLLFVWRVVTVVKIRLRQERFDVVLKKMRGGYPCKEIVVDSRHYLAAFIPQNAHYYSEMRIGIPFPEDVKENMAGKGDFQWWGIFCTVDIVTIETYLKFNPTLRTLNIPCGNVDGLLTHPIYKVVRVK